MSSVFSSARPKRSPRSFKAWLAFCTALVTLSAAEWRMLFPETGQEEHQKLARLTYSDTPAQGEHPEKARWVRLWKGLECLGNKSTFLLTWSD